MENKIPTSSKAWRNTTQTGISYREHGTRRHGTKLDRYYKVRFKVSGKQVVECYGWSSEGWTLKKVAVTLTEMKLELKSGEGTGKLADRREKVRNEQEEKRIAPTVSDLWDAYQISLSLKKKKKAAATTKGELRYWTATIEPALGTLKVEDITPMIISDLLDKVAVSAPVSANRLHSILSILFKVAIQKGWITIHPLQWLDKPGGEEPPRKRILTDDEINFLWTYFDKLCPNPRDILKLGLLTAQRSGEIMSMKWDDVDMDAAIWRQETNKTDTIHLVPLSPQVMEILSSRERKTKWVFPSVYNRAKGANAGHAKTTKNARRKVQEDSGITGWTGHDLRRTARTIMSRLRIKHHIRERVLNHSQGGIVGVYDQHDYLQEKADAMNKLGREIYRIIGIGTEKAKITKLQVVNS